MSTKPPSGTRDFLPDEIRRREHVIHIVREVYERYGFEPLETPALENIDTLLGKYGEEGNRLIFKILRRGEHEARGETDLALRYDLTVPLARVVAQYQGELPRFFKRYQIQPVWRADRPARGRFREFYQCDIDAVGSTSAVIEVEQLAAVSEVLLALGFDDFTIHVNHRQLLTAMLNDAGIGAEQQVDALVALDKLDKIGRDKVVQELEARGIAEASRVRLLDGIDGASDPEWLNRLERKPAPFDAGGRAGALNLQEILSLSVGTVASGRLRVDPSLARGLSYYTGAIMEVRTPDSPGSLAAGGRYDNLIGMFLGRDVPACGFSLGLERIIVVMAERKMFPAGVERGSVDVMVTLWNQESRADALSLASELRRSGLRVDVFPEPEKLGKQFKYASSRGVPFVALVGDDERALGKVSVKNLRTGEQRLVSRDQAAVMVRDGLVQNPDR